MQRQRLYGQGSGEHGLRGQLATTPTSITVGTTLVEVRYSKTCGAAWARITQAVAGDSVVVSAGARLGRPVRWTPTPMCTHR
ncbi:DUF2690 domain-containing protein [Streptomyces kaempferi]